MLTVVIVVFIYCLLCWIIGFTLVFFGKVHDDVSSAATTYAPLMPFAYLWIFVEEKIIYDAEVRTYQRAAKWIAAELQKNGIRLHQFGAGNKLRYYNYNALRQACEVQAELQPENVDKYREVYARAIKKFHWIFTPKELCSSAFPEWPLDDVWARKIGIEEYFTEHFNSCIYCNNKQSMGWRWGNNEFHTKPRNELRRIYQCADNSEKLSHGWLCHDCEIVKVGQWKQVSVS